MYVLMAVLAGLVDGGDRKIHEDLWDDTELDKVIQVVAECIHLGLRVNDLLYIETLCYGRDSFMFQQIHHVFQQNKHI